MNAIENHPKDLQEIIEYAMFLGMVIDQKEAQAIQDYYSPPGGDGIWRNGSGIISDWHRCVVTWKAHRRDRETRTGPDPSPILRPAKCVMCGQAPTIYREELTSHVCNPCFAKWIKEHTCSCGEKGRFRRESMAVMCDNCLIQWRISNGKHVQV